MTRAMLVAVLHRLAGSPSVSGKMPFTDVEADTWYTEAVLWAYQNDIVAGTSDTTFEPLSNITREQIVAIFSRYTAKFAPDKAKAAAELTAFADSASVSDWAVNDRSGPSRRRSSAAAKTRASSTCCRRTTPAAPRWRPSSCSTARCKAPRNSIGEGGFTMSRTKFMGIFLVILGVISVVVGIIRGDMTSSAAMFIGYLVPALLGAVILIVDHIGGGETKTETGPSDAALAGQKNKKKKK